MDQLEGRSPKSSSRLNPSTLSKKEVHTLLVGLLIICPSAGSSGADAFSVREAADSFFLATLLAFRLVLREECVLWFL